MNWRCAHCRREVPEGRNADLAQKLYRSPGGLRFAFGKNKDKRVMDEPDYVSWMINKANFPGSTVDALREELARG